MSTAALGSRSAAVEASVELRIRDLERSMGRVASRTLNGSPGYDSKRISAASTAGWAVGTWVKLSGGNWTTAATSSTFAPDAIGVVLLVIDSTTAEIVTAGYVQLLGTSYTVYTRYYLSTVAGAATSTAPAAPNVLQPLFIAHQDGWIEVDGPAGAFPRSVALAGLRDVTLTSPSDGQLLKYDFATSRWINGATTLALLSDVALAAVSDQQVLSYNAGTAKWVNRTLTLVSTLAGLSDVTITSVANLDFLRYDSGTSKWKNVNLGPMAYSASTTSLVLDGGSGGTAINVGIGATGSRFIVGGPGLPIDFILTAVGTPATDICARILRTSTTRVSFYDQAVGASNGTEVLRWQCSSSAGSRSFDFQVPINLSTALTVANGGTAATDALTAAVNLLMVRFAFDRAGSRLTTTSSSTHTFNASSKIFMVVMSGGGGGGGASTGSGSGNTAGAGGGSGELVIVIGKITAATMTYLAGAAGAAASDGSATTMTMNGETVSAAGGKKGPTASGTSQSGYGGAGGTTDWGTGAQSPSFMVLRFPGNAGGFYSINALALSAGSVTTIHQTAGAGGQSLVPSNSVTYGAGGNGGWSGSAGAAGTQGVLMVYEA